MIVRTYGRRSRCINGSYSDSSFNGDHEDVFTESLPQESSQEIYSFAFSSQDSSPWSFDSDILGSNSSQGSLPLPPPRAPVTDSSSQGNGVAPKSKKPRHLTMESKEIKNSKSSISKGTRSVSMPVTSTLMEAQEFGEMMEHVDEVNFALDGLRKAQPFRIRRASLLSLLSICATPTQRRLLRAQGMAKAIIDAILALSLDDSPSTLAAATLFYILANDGQDDLLDSPICIQFLLKLLSPSMITTAEDKGPTIGCKLLALCRDPGTLRDQSKRLDASSTAIISKVQEILLSCKEIPSSNGGGEGLRRPELSPKWIALLILEKSCLTTVSLEDTSGTVRKVGGNFKERLRELGGLDAVFNVAVNCHSIMEGWSKHSLFSLRELKDGVALQTVVLLLKCLKIMENATFLSKDNQNHLLGINGKLNCKGSRLSFTGLVISAIKILSGLSLLQNSSISSDNKSHCHSDGLDNAFENLQKECPDVDQDGILSSNSSSRFYRTEKASLVKGFKVSQKHQRSSTSHSVYTVSSSENTSAFTADVFLVKKEENSSMSGSCNGTSRSSNGIIPRNISNPKMSLGLGKRRNVAENNKYTSLEESQDPFAFDEGEFVPSKWDLLSMGREVSQTQNSRVTIREEDECQAPQMTSHHESKNGENYHSCEFTCSPAVEEENSNLLADCLLTAVKVLMNLTNDNPVGCKQIAACGGLETLSALIIGHFPSFSSCFSPCSQTEKNIFLPKWNTELEHQNDMHFTDQELDFLVAILGLLVNLVEKDSQNRSRLAAASVLLPTPGGSEVMDGQRDVIPLLCSIFLANQGAGEAAGEGGPLPWADEDAVLQGEREAEKMIIEAYAALLLAFLSTESKNVREAIAYCLPDNNLEVLVPVLERFVAFHLTLNMISPETHKAVSEVIESCRGN